MVASNSFLADLVARSQLISGRDLARLVFDAGQAMGLTATGVYVTDLQQTRLIALPQPVSAGEPTLDIDSSLAGLAYRMERTHLTQDGMTAWIPMVDGVERLGVLKACGHDLPVADCEALAAVTALLLVSKSSYSDLLVEAERRQPMTVQAELLWAFLPPRTIGTAQATSTAVLEPAYSVGGDAFDHSFTDNGLHLVLLDAMGHDLASGGASAAGLAACRATRRSGGRLTDIVTEIDRILDEWFTDRLMTAIIADLDVTDGTLTWVNCAHPPPLLVRGGQVLHILQREPDLPLGWNFHSHTPPTTHRARLQPGDRILLYSDGVTEARSPEGDLFGEQRLADTVIRAMTVGEPAPEALRRLLQQLKRHQEHQMSDDATIVMAEWHPTP
ncbi:PP2C family protein-serine/threonine phosphatase [Streptomyces sp. NPDC102437]|uniref:PP2C family protein-serine/threonine phosphatase n=1 Tax=Streptomyces sp. NPDC102437 TaxID=3366175 RepID=UPI00381DE394